MWVKQLAMICGGVGFALLSLRLLSLLAPRLDLIDHPEGRKAHTTPTPLVGGIGIALASLLALAFGASLDGQVGTTFESSRYLGLLFGATGLLVLGAIDDRRPVPARFKLVIQLVLCLVAIVLD